MQEISRQKKVLDLMLTAHSVMRDRYRYISSSVDILLIVASVVLNVVVFIDENYILKMTGINSDHQRFIAGIASIMVFAISIILLRVRWKEKAEDHARALEQLFKLIQESRVIIDSDDGVKKNEAIETFNEKYVTIFNSIVNIPDKKFNSLKMIHKRKIELSKMIDRFPGSRLFILKMRLFFSSFKEKNS